MENTFIIGEVLKPQGIKGELKIRPLTDDATRFKKLKSVIIDGDTFTVTNAKITPDSVFLSILGVNDRNTAELFRGKFLRIKREDNNCLEEGRYFIVDIIGCSIILDGKEIAKITEVTSARTDIITAVSKENKVIRFPFLKDAVTKVDVENKIFQVDSKRFKEIALYED